MVNVNYYNIIYVYSIFVVMYGENEDVQLHYSRHFGWNLLTISFPFHSVFTFHVDLSYSFFPWFVVNGRKHEHSPHLYIFRVWLLSRSLISLMSIVCSVLCVYLFGDRMQNAGVRCFRCVFLPPYRFYIIQYECVIFTVPVLVNCYTRHNPHCLFQAFGQWMSLGACVSNSIIAIFQMRLHLFHIRQLNKNDDIIIMHMVDLVCSVCICGWERCSKLTERIREKKAMIIIITIGWKRPFSIYFFIFSFFWQRRVGYENRSHWSQNTSKYKSQF